MRQHFGRESHISKMRQHFGRGSHISKIRQHFGRGSHISKMRQHFGRGSHISKIRQHFGRGSHISKMRQHFGRGSHISKIRQHFGRGSHIKGRNVPWSMNRGLKPLPNDKILDWSKLKAFADAKINVAQKLKFVYGRIEIILGKGENAGNEHFLLSPQCFLKSSIWGGVNDWLIDWLIGVLRRF